MNTEAHHDTQGRDEAHRHDAESRTGSLVELILAAADTSEDQWEIGDRLDDWIEMDRSALVEA